MRGADNRAVEHVFRLNALFSGRIALELFLTNAPQLQDMLNFLIVRPPARKRCRFRLENHARLVQITQGNFGIGQHSQSQQFRICVLIDLIRHKRALSAPNNQQSLRGQNPDGFAQGCAADAQLFRQVVFIGQLFSKMKFLLFDDHMTQLIRCALRECIVLHDIFFLILAYSLSYHFFRRNQ